MKRTIIIIAVALFCNICSIANAQKQGKIQHDMALQLGLSTGTSSLDKIATAIGEDGKSLTIGNVGLAFNANVFFINNLAFHIHLDATAGREMSDFGERSKSSMSIAGELGLEYFFNLGNSNQLSLAAGWGERYFDWWHTNFSARYAIGYLPISLTFWHKHFGYSVGYEANIGRVKSLNNPASLPDAKPSFLYLALRMR